MNNTQLTHVIVYLAMSWVIVAFIPSTPVKRLGAYVTMKELGILALSAIGVIYWKTIVHTEIAFNYLPSDSMFGLKMLSGLAIFLFICWTTSGGSKQT